MKAPSPIAVIRSVLGPEQAEALLRGGVAPESLARTVLEATAPADLAATLAAAGLEKAEPLSARTVLAVQNLVRLNQMRADRAIREVALGKAEGLEKRSKNVREKTTNITPEQAEGRRVRYAQSLGLEPTKTQGEGMPKPSRNKLPYGGNFPVEHEVAHAMMTPGGKTIRQYTDSLGSRASAGKRAIEGDRDGKDIPHNFNDLYHDYHDAEQEENTARMLENQIDRRSGVNPSRPELQARAQITAGAPMHSFRRIDVPEEHPFNNHWDYSDEEIEDEPTRGRLFRPKDSKQLEQEARSGAREEIQRWDAGSRFKGGKVVPPSGLDARINARAAVGGFRKAEPVAKSLSPKSRWSSYGNSKLTPHGNYTIHSSDGRSVDDANEGQRFHVKYESRGETAHMGTFGSLNEAKDFVDRHDDHMQKSEPNKLPPDQKGVGLPHPAAPKLAPTKQLDPRVKPNRGAKKQQFSLGKAEPFEAGKHNYRVGDQGFSSYVEANKAAVAGDGQLHLHDENGQLIRTMTFPKPAAKKRVEHVLRMPDGSLKPFGKVRRQGG